MFIKEWSFRFIDIDFLNFHHKIGIQSKNAKDIDKQAFIVAHLLSTNGVDQSLYC